LAAVFFTVVFLAGVCLAAVFLAGAFFAVVFLAADFLAVCLAGALLADAFFAVAFLVAVFLPEVLLLVVFAEFLADAVFLPLLPAGADVVVLFAVCFARVEADLALDVAVDVAFLAGALDIAGTPSLGVCEMSNTTRGAERIGNPRCRFNRPRGFFAHLCGSFDGSAAGSARAGQLPSPPLQPPRITVDLDQLAPARRAGHQPHCPPAYPERVREGSEGSVGGPAVDRTLGHRHDQRTVVLAPDARPGRPGLDPDREAQTVAHANQCGPSGDVP